MKQQTSETLRQTMVILGRDQVERLDKVAARQLTSRSQLIRQGIERILADAEQPIKQKGAK